MNFKAPFYGILAAYLEKTLRGHHIGRPILYSHKAVAFSVSGTSYKRLFFTLDGNEPMVLLSETEEKVRSFESSFLSVLKSELQNALVVSVSPVAGDRILVFELKINDAAYQEVTRRLVYEAVSHHPNLILLDENDKIIAAYRPSSLDSSRPILRGMAYLPPKKTFQPLEQYGPEDLERYLEKGKEREAQLKEERRRDRYGRQILETKRRIKLLERKLEAYQKDEEEARLHLDDGKIGSAFYTGEGLDYEKGILLYEGKEYPFDPHLKLSLTAEKYFQRAKKAKTALSQIAENHKTCQAELEEKRELLEFLEGADEALLEETLGMSDMTHKRKKNVKGGKPLPRLVTCGGSLKAYYGHSARENDALTFLYTKNPRFHWFHVKDHSGPHVVLRKENPSQREIDFAASLAVYAAGLEGGEVIHALKGDLRKGNVPGQVILNAYKSLFVKDIDPLFRKAFIDGGVKR